MSPPPAEWRPLPPLEPPRPTRRERIKRFFSFQRCYDRLQCGRCSIKSRGDQLLVCCIVQIVLSIASAILTTIKVLICGIDDAEVWCYAFFLMMLFSGVSTAQYVRTKTERGIHTFAIFCISLLAVAITSFAITVSTRSLRSYFHPVSTVKDSFCHDGVSWMAYLNVHFITMYFIQACGMISAAAQAVIALLLFLSRWAWWRRRLGDVDRRRGAPDEEAETSDDDSEEEDDDVDDDGDARSTDLQLDSIRNDAHTDPGHESDSDREYSAHLRAAFMDLADEDLRDTAPLVSSESDDDLLDDDDLHQEDSSCDVVLMDEEPSPSDDHAVPPPNTDDDHEMTPPGPGDDHEMTPPGPGDEHEMTGPPCPSDDPKAQTIPCDDCDSAQDTGV